MLVSNYISQTKFIVYACPGWHFVLRVIRLEKTVYGDTCNDYYSFLSMQVRSAGMQTCHKQGEEGMSNTPLPRCIPLFTCLPSESTLSSEYSHLIGRICLIGEGSPCHECMSLRANKANKLPKTNLLPWPIPTMPNLTRSVRTL